MRVAVTGGAGFIGANLCRHLIASGDEVVVIDDLSTGFRSNLDGLPLRLVVNTILDPTVLNEVFAGVVSVVHLAAQGSVPGSIANPMRNNEVNVTGTLNVLQSARQVGAQVIIASSSSVYGANQVQPKHEALQVIPMSPYAVSKLAAESYALVYQKIYGIKTVVFRLFNIFGPLQSARHEYAAVIPAFASALLDGVPLRVYGDGQQTRDFTSVGTVAEVMTRAIHQQVSSESAVNLASGIETTLLELISLLEDRISTKAQIDWLATRDGDIRTSRADNSVLRSLFPGVRPQSLRSGLDDTITWWLETGGRQS